MIICSKFHSLQQCNGFYLIKTNTIDIKLYFVTPYIIRLQALFSEEPEASYALVLTAWEDKLDSMFSDERTRITPVLPEFTETEDQILFQTGEITLRLQKAPLAFSLYDKERDCLHADLAGNPFVQDSNMRIWHYSQISDEDCFYGFGEQGGSINKAGKWMRLSPKDAMGYDGSDTNPLYKHIPFYTKLNPNTKKAIGYFYHNTYECEFVMGRERSNYWPHYSKYGADGGNIDLFLIAGPSMGDVIRRYASLTGTSVLLPRYALGFLGSSMYYSELEENCDRSILEFADTCAEEDIPIDGFHLSSGYTSENGKRYVFTWNHDRFPDPKQFFQSMEEKGITISPNVKPGILLSHPFFAEFQEKDLFVKSSDGDGPCIGKWWGGDGAYVDFTEEKNRNTWQSYLTGQVLQMGTASVWNDNCEYDGILDKDALCSFEGMGGTIGRLKAVMSNLMCYTTVLAIRNQNENIRPFIICRSGYSGIQRYASTWAGDNVTSWKSLKYNIATVLGMGISGVANQGCDIGGFYGKVPGPELFVRWVQNGIFQPRFSIHSTNTDNTVTEPWMYEDCTGYIRDAIHFRYRLNPYLYSLMHQAHEDGTPIMRAMCLDFQQDPNCYEEGIDFMLGSSLLVANVVEEGACTRSVYLPEGDNFYDFYTRRFYKGGQQISIPVTLASIPVFVRTGAIVPLSLYPLHNLHWEVIHGLHFLMEVSKKAEFNLYEDDGVTNDYKKGSYLSTCIRIFPGLNTRICFQMSGAYETTVEDIMLDVIAPEKAPCQITVDGKKLNHFLYYKKFEEAAAGWYYNQTLQSILIKYKNILSDYEVTISFEPLDLIGM